MRRLAVFLTVLAILALSSCVSLPPRSEFQSTHGVLLRGKITEEEVKDIDEMLAVFPLEVIKSIKSISVRDDDNHFGQKEVAHCHWGRDICIPLRFIKSRFVLWHEVGHAYNFQLNQYSSGFSAEWRRIAGDVYEKSETEISSYPHEGVLTQYGRTNYREDIAEWCEAIYSFLDGRFSALTSLRQIGALMPGTKYFDKLTLLWKFGFITEKDFNKIIL